MATESDAQLQVIRAPESPSRRTVLMLCMASAGLISGVFPVAANNLSKPPDSQRAFLAGGDVSVLPLMERYGTRYYGLDGKQGDALRIMRDAGHNVVRLRLYESPGPGRGHEGYYWLAGSMDLADVLRMARRSAALGMQIELSFHYSDFWTNGEIQTIPATWQKQLEKLHDEVAKFQRLRELVFERTRSVMQALQAQGTVPQYISIGNEIQAGLLYPYGALSEKNWPRLAALFQAGYEGVKAVAPESQVVIHLDDAGNTEKYNYFFDNLKAHGVRWDVIGASYYPFWAKKTVAQLDAFVRDISARYDKDLFVMEAGFNFAPTTPTGRAGQLANNGPYPDSMSTPDGQKAFVDELMFTMRRNPRVIGVLYWDPIMIEKRGVGWAWQESDDAPGVNVVANTTLFDFEGRALPVLAGWHAYTGIQR